MKNICTEHNRQSLFLTDLIYKNKVNGYYIPNIVK